MSGRFETLRGRGVLVTGGAGFLGSRLVRRLLVEGAQVTVLDNLNPAYGGNPFNLSAALPHMTFLADDIRNVAVLEACIPGQDFIFCLAGQTSHMGSMEQPMEDVQVNVIGQMNILETCRRLNPGARLVYTSTRQIYGTPDYLPVDEAHPIRPPDVNGISKHAAENYHLLYHRYHGISSTILRLTNCYGPGMRIKDARQMFLGIWLRLAIEGRPFAIFGDGQQRRDFNYVDDVVNALLLAATRDEAAGRVYNLGAPEAPSLTELAQLLVELVPGASFDYVPFPADRKQIDIGSCRSDYGRIAEELGWQPGIQLRQGLSESLAFYRDNFSSYT